MIRTQPITNLGSFPFIIFETSIDGWVESREEILGINSHRSYMIRVAFVQIGC